MLAPLNPHLTHWWLNSSGPQKGSVSPASEFYWGAQGKHVEQNWEREGYVAHPQQPCCDNVWRLKIQPSTQRRDQCVERLFMGVRWSAWRVRGPAQDEVPGACVRLQLSCKLGLVLGACDVPWSPAYPLHCWTEPGVSSTS